MSFSYKPLWRLLLELNVTKTQMRGELGLSSTTLAKMSKDEYVSMEVLDRLCSHYQVQPNNIIEWKEDTEDANISL